MGVFIYQDDALQKMAQVEGKEYGIQQRKDHDNCSFNTFRKKWRALLRKNTGLKKLSEFAISIDSNSTIYGFGGWHRYRVLNTGEICFIRAACSGATFHQGEHVALAKRVGFRIW